MKFYQSLFKDIAVTIKISKITIMIGFTFLNLDFFFVFLDKERCFLRLDDRYRLGEASTTGEMGVTGVCTPGYIGSRPSGLCGTQSSRATRVSLAIIAHP